MALSNHDIRSVTGTEYDGDDVLHVQFDTYGPNSTCPAVELHHNFGFQSRAADPDADGRGCQVHTAYEGDRQHAWLSHDGRVLSRLPPIKKGESRQYGYAGNFVRCHDTGAISMYTTDAGGDPSGQSVYAQVAPDKFVRTAPWGTERYDAGGWRLSTHTGARIAVGGVGGLPSPLDSMGSYFSVECALVTISCKSASFGDGAVPLAKADPLIAILTDIVTALAQVVALAGTPGTGSTAISADPGLTADMAALSALMASAKVTLSSIVSGA